MQTPLGCDPHHVMAVGIPLRANAYAAARGTYFEQLRAKVAETPGVTMAAISSNATPPRNGWDLRFEILGQPATQEQKASLNLISPGTRHSANPADGGPDLGWAENRNAARVAVISRRWRSAFPNGGAINGRESGNWGRTRPTRCRPRRRTGTSRGDCGDAERRDVEPGRASGVRTVYTAHVALDAGSGEDRGAP
jgi:hypothetical protein